MPHCEQQAEPFMRGQEPARTNKIGHELDGVSSQPLDSALSRAAGGRNLAPSLALTPAEDEQPMDRSTPSKGRRGASRAALRLLPDATSYPDLALRDPSLPAPTLDRTAQGRIGRELRAMYADLERQPLPQRLLDLVSKLAEPKG
jgi:hypothetical protein